MATQENSGYIELIGYTQPTQEQRADPNYKTKLTVNQKALKIIYENFQSPISILVFTGDMGAGKSKLASLTVATLLQQKYDKALLPFQSGPDATKVTRGVWMWRLPLKHLNNKKGSILLLDCEGVNSFSESISADLYLFCMIISTVFGVIFRLARVDPQLGNRLYDALHRFEDMKTPSILPNLWSVPLELPHLKDNGKLITENQWIQKVFSAKVAEDLLSTTDSARLEGRFQYIRDKLRKIDVANITYLPHCFKEDDFNINDMFTALREKSNEGYFNSLIAAINRFTQSPGKRLPGSSSPTLFFRPAELAHFMNDLIDVINQDKDPNPDELIGKYLLKRFIDEVMIQKEVEFRRDLLMYTEGCAKENLKKKETEAERQNIDDNLRETRNSLIKEYIDKIKTLAETKIYGANSILLESALFNNKLDEVKQKMNQYDEPEILISEIRKIYSSRDQNDQQREHQELSADMKKKIERIIDRICREERINVSIDLFTQSELQVERQQCEKCGRSGGYVSIIHSKKCCSSKRQGNYYRYNNEPDKMVCNACREIESIKNTCIKCSQCKTICRITPIP